MIILILYFLTWISWICRGAFALSDLLSDDIGTASRSSALNLFDENPSDESLWDTDIISSCTNGDMGQPSKLRARDTVCPSGSLTPPSTQIEVPEMLNFLDIENAVKKAGYKPTTVFNYMIKADGVSKMTDNSIAYCAWYAEKGYSLPVCGSGFLLDRVPKTPPYYSKVENSRLRKCI